MKYNLIAVLAFVMILSCQDKEKENTDTVPSGSPLENISASIDQNPTDAALYYERSKIYISGGNYQGALIDMERALRLDSTRSEYYSLLADLFLEIGNLKKARLTTNAGMIKFPDEEEFPLKAAKIEIYRRNYGDALALLNEVLKMDISNPTAYFWKGIMFKEAGDTNKAISNLQTCVEQDPQFYDAYMQLGLLHSTKKDKFAVDYFNNAKRVRPDAVEPMYFKGIYYQKNGEYKKAVSTLKEVIESDPLNEKAHFKIGYVYFQMDSVEKAYRSFDRAIETDPQFSEAFYMKGLCAETLGNLDEAIKYYKQTLNFNPDNELAQAGVKRIQ